MKKWNKGKLDRKYYKGISNMGGNLSGEQRTKYRWGFAKNLSEKEKDEMQQLRDNVDSQTNVQAVFQGFTDQLEVCFLFFFSFLRKCAIAGAR